MTLAAAVLTSTLAAAALIWQAQAIPRRAAVEPLDLEVTAATRLLVLAPHPDDEALGAAGLIARVIERGGAVHVVLLTSGDAFPEAVEATEGVKSPTPSDYRNFGVVRERETRAAMTTLGVRPGAISFLGFPDEGICLLASRYLFDKRRVFESPYTDRVRPPQGEQIVRGASYRGVDVRRELEAIITDFRPTLLLLPHPEDEHPDHCSTPIFAHEALEAVPLPHLRVLHYLVHYGQWPLQQDALSELQPPGGFPAAEGRWTSLALTAKEAALKRDAIAAYASQMRIIGRFMLSFARDNELFLDGEPASVPECWCDGQNVATEASPSRYRRRPR